MISRRVFCSGVPSSDTVLEVTGDFRDETSYGASNDYLWGVGWGTTPSISWDNGITATPIDRIAVQNRNSSFPFSNVHIRFTDNTLDTNWTSLLVETYGTVSDSYSLAYAGYDGVNSDGMYWLDSSGPEADAFQSVIETAWANSQPLKFTIS